MKKILISLISSISLAVPSHGYAEAPGITTNLAGEYSCSGYDRQDHYLTQKLTVKYDAKNSIPENGYGTYSVKAEAPTDLKVKGLPANIVVIGSMATSGNTFAINFHNTNPKAPADNGVVVGVSTYDQDQHGIGRTTLHFFSYQPNYKGGDNSLWTCVSN
jgi:hypothetical protein